jgi:hypothetical protein
MLNFFEFFVIIFLFEWRRKAQKIKIIFLLQQLTMKKLKSTSRGDGPKKRKLNTLFFLRSIQKNSSNPIKGFGRYTRRFPDM